MIATNVMLSEEELSFVEHFGTVSDADLIRIKTAIINLVSPHAHEGKLVPNDIRMSAERVPNLLDEEADGYRIMIYNENSTYCAEVDAKDRTLIALYQILPVDIEEIKASCQLKPFPIHLSSDDTHQKSLRIDPHGDLVCSDGIADSTVEKWNVCFLYRKPNTTHEALAHNAEGADTGKFGEDLSYFLLPPQIDEKKHDQETSDRKALILNRYAWGMNVAVAIADLKRRTIYVWGSWNFDHPEGIALRFREDQTAFEKSLQKTVAFEKSLQKTVAFEKSLQKTVEIYLSNDNVTRSYLFRAPGRGPLPCIDNAYPGSAWKKFPVADELAGLQRYLAWCDANEQDGPGDAKRDKPGDAKQDKPGDAKRDKPGDAKRDKPGDTKQDKPGDVKQDKPGDAKQDKPGDAKQDKPGDAKQDKPGDAKQDGPGDAKRYMPFTDRLDSLDTNLVLAYKKKNYDAAVGFGLQYLSVPGAEARITGVFNRLPDIYRVQYNIACCYAKIGRPGEAMSYLLSIEPRWQKWKHLRDDPDFAPLADRDDFKALIGRHTAQIAEEAGAENASDEDSDPSDIDD